MEKLLLLYAFVVLGSVIKGCGATQYMVGDSSGWDISTNLDTWVKDKTFNVGDLLVFQYSSSHSVSEVTRENFNGCNTTNVLQTYNSTGNNTVSLKEPGERFFVCGNKLHCLGGMKLKVNVKNNSQSNTPVGAPQATTGSGQGTDSNFSNPSSKANKEIPTSKASFNRPGMNSIVLIILVGFVSMLLNLYNFCM